MATTTYSTKLRLAIPTTGELADTWGNLINTGLTALVDDAIAGIATVSHPDTASYTLTANNAASDEARCAVLKITGALTAARNVVCPTQPKLYIVHNATTGGFAITLKTAAGTGVVIPHAASMQVRCDGTDVFEATWPSADLSNTVVGYEALLAGRSTTSSCAAVGYQALYSTTTGVRNTAVGRQTLRNTTTGASNVALGYQALYTNSTGTYGVAIGDSALYSDTVGNNVAVGGQALYANSTGTGHTAVGRQALTANTTGARNSAFGNVALYANTIGSDNSAFGLSALQNNTEGSYNSAVGLSALHSNTTGSNNSALGYQALLNMTLGNANAAVGQHALYTNSSGSGNAAVGGEALYTSTGSNNTAIGWRAGQLCTTGHDNTAIGYKALQALTTGSGNVGIGPQDSAGNHTPVFNVTTENNRISMGSTAVTNAYIQVAWTVVSDARDKTDFAPVPHGLEFICAMKPTAYRYKATRDAVEGHGPVRYGFKAQDVLALEGPTSVIVDAEDHKKLRFNDQALLAVLVNAIQELRAEVRALQQK